MSKNLNTCSVISSFPNKCLKTIKDVSIVFLCSRQFPLKTIILRRHFYVIPLAPISFRAGTLQAHISQHLFAISRKLRQLGPRQSWQMSNRSRQWTNYSLSFVRLLVCQYGSVPLLVDGMSRRLSSQHTLYPKNSAAKPFTVAKLRFFWIGRNT